MAHAAGDFNLLPAELLARVLQHVPVDQRLGVCAVVSTTWHAAAIAATTSIVVQQSAFAGNGDASTRTARILALPPWLQQYGAAAQLCRLKLEITNTVSCSSFCTALNMVLPALEHLTALKLSVSQQQPVLEHLSSLHHLQDLVLSFDIELHPIIKALPVTLTSLVFYDNTQPIYEDEALPEACTLHHLTNLQCLTVNGRCTSISFAEVARLLQLRTFIMRAYQADATLVIHSPMSELACLTGLQHLDLPRWMSFLNSEVELSAADCAAVTASSQLTHLNLSCWQLAPWQTSAVFPAGRKLPYLQESHVGPSFLHSATATAALCSWCPNLTSLYVECLDMSDTGFEYDSSFEECVTTSACLEGLQQLNQLQELHLQDMRLKDPGMWGVLSCLTTLTRLEISSISIPCLPGILQLTALTRLRKSEVEVAVKEDGGWASSSCCVVPDCFLTQSSLYDGLDLAEITRFMYLPMTLVDCAHSLLDEVVTCEIHHVLEPMMDAYPKACEGAVEVLLQQQDALRAWACLNRFARGHAAMSGSISACEEAIKKQIESATALLQGMQHEAGPEQPDSMEKLVYNAMKPVLWKQLKASQQQEAALSGGKDVLQGLREDMAATKVLHDHTTKTVELLETLAQLAGEGLQHSIVKLRERLHKLVLFVQQEEAGRFGEPCIGFVDSP